MKIIWSSYYNILQKEYNNNVDKIINRRENNYNKTDIIKEILNISDRNTINNIKCELRKSRYA